MWRKMPTRRLFMAIDKLEQSAAILRDDSYAELCLRVRIEEVLEAGENNVIEFPLCRGK